jgi:VWFA-related protein
VSANFTTSALKNPTVGTVFTMRTGATIRHADVIVPGYVLQRATKVRLPRDERGAFGVYNVGMSFLRKSPLLCLLLLAPALDSQNSSTAPATTPPAAQGPATPTTTMSVDVKVVTLPVTVRDKHGKIVTNLSKDDFALEEDGKPQTIRYFNQETNLPLTVGLLVDTSESERDNLDKERAASRTFLDQMITRPADRAFVIHFDRQVELLQDLTADHGKLEKAVGEIDTTSSVQNTPTSDQESGGSHRGHGAGTLLYDAIFLACDEVMKKQTGRKAIVVLTDGEDRGSQETLNSAIESAQRSETVVYTIYYGGHEDHDNGPFNNGGGRGGYPGGGYPGGRYPGGGYPGGGYPGGSRYPQQQNRPDGKKILQRIAQETGGRYFEVKKKDSVDDVYASIAEELRTQFILGYTPPKDQSSGYHSIHLTTKNKDQAVQTREGYYSGQ